MYLVLCCRVAEHYYCEADALESFVFQSVWATRCSVDHHNAGFCCVPQGAIVESTM